MSAIPLALPKTLLSSPDGATSPGVQSQFVKVLPNNISQVVSAETSFTGGTANVPIQITLGSQQVNWDIPTGMGNNVFCDTAKSTISYRVRFEVTSASTATYGTVNAFLQSSAHSFINRMSTYVAGNMVDDVTNYDLAMAEQVNWGYDIAQRDTLFNLGLVAEQDDTSSLNVLQGHKIPAFIPSGATPATALVVGSSYFSYELPLANALLGTGNRSMCPVGKLAKTQLSIYTPQVAPVILTTSVTTGEGCKVKITIDQWAVNLFYITLDEPSMRLLSPAKEHYMAGVTYRVGSGAIGASTAGSVSVQIPIRVKSCRSLSTRFSENALTTAGSLNGQFDSKMPLGTLNYFISSQKRVPPNPHNSLIAPATLYSRALMANYDSAYEPWKMKSSQMSSSYFSYVSASTPPTTANADQLVITATSTTAPSALSTFSFCEDLRSASSANFLSGCDLTTSNSFLELNIANQSSHALNVVFIAKADIIFVVLPDGSVESRV